MLTPSSLLLVAKLGTSTSPGTSAPRPLLFLLRLAIPPPVLGGSAPWRGGKGSVIACGPWIRYTEALGDARGLRVHARRRYVCCYCCMHRSEVSSEQANVTRRIELLLCTRRSRTKSCNSDPGQDLWIPEVRCNLRLGRQEVPRSRRPMCAVGKGLLCQQSDVLLTAVVVLYYEGFDGLACGGGEDVYMLKIYTWCDGTA